jgi:serine/threonine-protein kinase HipA
VPTLDVWLYGRRTGQLAQVDGQLRFAYADDYAADDDAVPLSCSLPLERREYRSAAQAFFANLLPEGDARTLVARGLGLSAGNDFGLLDAIGGDCAGAVSLLPPGAATDPAATPGGEIRWLDETALAAALDDLPTRPLLADPEDGIRLSLAGAQDKLPVVVRDERIGIPLGRTPSTHIVKTPIARFDDTVTNEAFCLALARALGLPTAFAEVREAAGREFLLVERYDRRHGDGGVARIHQEDFCQALGIPPQLKYESEGGPGLGDSFDLLRRASVERATDLLALVDAVTLNYLIGNHDAHGKNFSLLLADGGPRLAPLYDLVSTAVYPGLDRKLAMAIGGERRPEYVRRRHVERFSDEARLGAAAVRRRMLRMTARARAAAPSVASELDGRPVLERVLATIDRRAGWLEDQLA